MRPMVRSLRNGGFSPSRNITASKIFCTFDLRPIAGSATLHPDGTLTREIHTHFVLGSSETIKSVQAPPSRGLFFDGSRVAGHCPRQ
jgi:hypothetical protein